MTRSYAMLFLFFCFSFSFLALTFPFSISFSFSFSLAKNRCLRVSTIVERASRCRDWKLIPLGLLFFRSNLSRRSKGNSLSLNRRDETRTRLIIYIFRLSRTRLSKISKHFSPIDNFHELESLRYVRPSFSFVVFNILNECVLPPESNHEQRRWFSFLEKPSSGVERLARSSKRSYILLDVVKIKYIYIYTTKRSSIKY